jgi:hypothetical protein
METKDVDKICRNGRATVSPSDKAWTSFDRLFSNSWFTRVWVIQEVCLNGQVTVQCGCHHVSWAELDHAVRLALVSDRLPLHKALFEFCRGFLSGARYDIANLVVRFQGCQWTRPQDKIFALGGLLSADAELEVVIHHGSSKARLYTDWTLACLKKTLSLDLVGSIGKDADCLPLNDHTEYLPSWVPDLTQKRTCLSLAYHHIFSPDSRNFAASPRPLGCQFIVSSSSESLLPLHGNMFARISELGLIAGDTNFKPKKFPFLSSKDSSVKDWLNEATAKSYWQLNWEKISQVRGCRRYPTGEDIEDAYWQTL